MTKLCPLGLYIHLPFCRKKCDYCNFYSVCSGFLDAGAMSDYVSALIWHAKLWKRELAFHTTDSLYLGGGTPSLLPPKEIFRLVKGVREEFNISSDAEITLEANPESLTGEVLSAAKESGVNRISIGMQSFDDNALAAIGRIHTAKDARLAFLQSRQAGYKNISIDIMYGLPGQSFKSLSHTLDTALELLPEHISCYLLKMEKGTPLYRRKNGLLLPGEDEQTKQYEYICRRLGKEGYCHYEVSNFARDKKESYHNLKYWNGSEYLGLGAAAHSLVKNTRFFYPDDIDEYQSMAGLGILMPENAVKRTPFDAAEEYILTGLRTIYGITLDNPVLAEVSLNISSMVSYAQKLSDFGFAKFEGRSLRLTEKGFWLSNTIIADMLKAAGL